MKRSILSFLGGMGSILVLAPGAVPIDRVPRPRASVSDHWAQVGQYMREAMDCCVEETEVKIIKKVDDGGQRRVAHIG